MLDRLHAEPDSPDVSLSKLKEERRGKLVGFMEQLDLDVVIGLSGGARGQRGIVRFLAEYATTSQSSCAVWARESSARLIVPYSVHRYWAKSMSWLDDIQVDAEYPAAIAAYLTERNATGAKVGWAGIPHLVDSVRSEVEILLPEVKSRLITSEFNAMRAVKTAEEVKLMRRSGAIADAVLQSLTGKLQSGITELDIVAEAEYAARRAASEGSSILIGTNSQLPGPIPQRKALRTGDVVQLSVEPEGPGGFWVQTVRMYAVGELPKNVGGAVSRCIAAQAGGASLLRDGQHVADVAQTMLEIMATNEAALAAPLGHGIGLDNSEQPRVSIRTPGALSTNMTIVLHPTHYAEGMGVFVGDTFLVQEDGVERLSRLPNDIIVV